MGRPNLSCETKFSGANADREILILSFQLTTSGFGNLTRLIRSPMTIHKYILYLYIQQYRCVCVFFPLILDIKFVGRTSRGQTGFFIHLPSAVRALIFLARRIQPFLSLVDREVEFFVLTIQPFSTRWAYIYILVRKIPFTGIELTSQRVRRLRGYF